MSLYIIGYDFDGSVHYHEPLTFPHTITMPNKSIVLNDVNSLLAAIKNRKKYVAFFKNVPSTMPFCAVVDTEFDD